MKIAKFYFHFYSITWILLVIHTLFVFYFYEPKLAFSLEKINTLALGLFTIIMQVQLVKLLSFRSRRASFVLTLLLLIVYAILYTFHYNQHVPLDYALVHENFSLIFYKESIASILSMLSISYFFYAIATIYLIYFLNKRFDLISQLPIKGEIHTSTFVFVILTNIALLSIPASNSNKIFEFIQSVHYYYANKSHDSLLGSDSSKYPYIHTNTLSGKFADYHDKPNVLLIFMESYNGLFTDKAADNGKIVTPFFNELKNKGYFLEHFYGHSIQTAKGQFGTLSGVYPSVYSKVFTTYGNLNLHGLPSILNDFGYETVFTKAYRSLSFDNTYNYAKKLGFKHVESMGVPKRLNKDDQGKIWGWGLQDDRFYIKFFDYLDSLHQQTPDKPFFATLTTVSNHMMFNKIPADQKYLYSGSHTNYTNFMNSLHLADHYLQTFFEELEKRHYLDNTIVIITGDHSWPSGNHGYWHNETSYYNEFFQIPFLILWDKHLEPEHNSITASQVDIAPTILDMLNIETKNHFVGKSIFTRTQEEPVLLVQPYSGTYIVAQDKGIKYVKHLRSKNEFLYDLNRDPDEKNNIIANPDYTKQLEALRQEAQKLLINNELIQTNRLWPPDEKAQQKQAAMKKVRHNFLVEVSQQYKPIRTIDSPKINEARKERFYIDTIDFPAKDELTHRKLGKLGFFNDFFTTITGNMDVKIAGEYDIFVASDDGFRLFVDGNRVAEFKGGSSMNESASYRIHLDKGVHTFKLLHYQGYGYVGLKMNYKLANRKNYRIFGSDSRFITFPLLK
jgi:phosphoglycerol transferase MdoB-like AlkP superfamily enzyme